MISSGLASMPWDACGESISIAEKHLYTEGVGILNAGRHVAIGDMVSVFGSISKWLVKHLMSQASFISQKRGLQPSNQGRINVYRKEPLVQYRNHGSNTGSPIHPQTHTR